MFSKPYRTHVLLFLGTFVCTTLAGAEWTTGTSLFSKEHPMGWEQLIAGLSFSVPFLLILTVHEFGHYFMAKYHRIAVTLPYYIPMWLGFLGIPSIGTAGAFIRIKEPMQSRTQYFDIGIAGPLAGFALALVVLYYGFTHLPSLEYIFTLHPEYQVYGSDYGAHVYTEKEPYLAFGRTFLFEFFQNELAPPSLLPHPYEMVHYPYLFAGYLALFFTALNLLPIGQLDGGHILYALVGQRWHGRISRAVFFAMLMYGLIGAVSPYMPWSDFSWRFAAYGLVLFFVLRRFEPVIRMRLLYVIGILMIQVCLLALFPTWQGYRGWFVFACLVGGVLGLGHPATYGDVPLSFGRKILGVVALIILVLCFSFNPFVFEGYE